MPQAREHGQPKRELADQTPPLEQISLLDIELNRQTIGSDGEFVASMVRLSPSCLRPIVKPTAALGAMGVFTHQRQGAAGEAAGAIRSH